MMSLTTFLVGVNVPDAQHETLQRIETLLTAILGVQVEQFLRETGVAKPRPRSVDRMLSDFGLSGVHIAELLGKTPQAVSNSLARDKKASTAKKAASASAESEMNGVA